MDELDVLPEKYTMSQEFDTLKNLAAEIQNLAPIADHDKFFKEEALRFISIGGTIEASFPNVDTSIDERIISHILVRSVIENFFKIVYIFEDSAQSAVRFDALLNGFKKDYTKLLNEPDLPMKDKLEPADSAWATLPSPMDLRSMMSQIRNEQGTKLDYIYFIYRISSFDTHGNSLKSLFDASFNKQCNFPFLKIDPVLKLIADQYLVIFNRIKKEAEQAAS